MNRRIVTIALALLLASAGTFMVLLYVRGADDRALAGKRAVDVLVAAKAVPAGTAAGALVSQGFARSVRMPANAVPADALNKIDEDVEEKVVGSAIRAGELIRRPLLVAKGSSEAFVIPNGKIAITVSLGSPQQVAGYVKAGSKVAVFISYKIQNKSDGKSDATAARLLMSNIEVLSVGAASSGDAEDAQRADAKSMVTLAVTQHQAEQLVWGSQGSHGSTLYLGLQTDASNLSEQSKGVSSFQLFQ